MWFAIALQDINDIPRGTLLEITEYTEYKIVVRSIGLEPPQRVTMHIPAWWIDNIGFHPNLYRV